MLDEVKVFSDEIDAADVACSANCDKLREARYRDDISSETYYERRDAYFEQMRKARDAAWNKLSSTTTDALVRFIAGNCREYINESMRVMQRLPLTLDELQNLADDEDWCGTWDDFLDTAIKAGVVSCPPRPASYAKLQDYLTRDGISRRRQRKIFTIVDEVVDEVVKGMSQSTN